MRWRRWKGQPPSVEPERSFFALGGGRGPKAVPKGPKRSGAREHPTGESRERPQESPTSDEQLPASPGYNLRC